ncbi:helix-turn-helix transcriptional regulator [Novosphingobium sp. SL115]|uniref:helix-turn-helix domain-containing protein n=1 Tax=Novosphingobium sp. SL115 TaxID=2995150 RepID=UPI002273D721|nr:helix-turn-helix transcriptional regulator [Novosphingobium sp. SL115]MCY1669493.1 helix-turn-helix transcriptional regulator [Novosphingobium sp. SL115]
MIARPGTLPLSAQQERVIALAAQGKTNDEISAEMGIALRTIDVHRRMAYAKMGASSAPQAIAIYLWAKIHALEEENARLRQKLSEVRN